MTDYQHAEAFMLMTYRAGDEEERIWNSRDGVTPFVITLKSGKVATHEDWHADVRAPDYQPQPGERIFADLTADRARELAEARVDGWLASPMRADLIATYGSRENAIEQQSRFEPGDPDLIVFAGDLPGGGGKGEGQHASQDL